MELWMQDCERHQDCERQDCERQRLVKATTGALACSMCRALP
jgi:hypothetical protein